MILAKGLGARSGKLNDKAENRKTFTDAIFVQVCLGEHRDG